MRCRKIQRNEAAEPLNSNLQTFSQDEFNAHRFLEGIGSTKRVVELRDELRAIDLDFNKRMAAIEFFLFHFKCKVEDFVSRPQGDNSEELAKAQKLLDEAQKALDEAIKKAGEAKAALDEVKALEAARDKKTQELTAKGEDMNLGVVARNKAKNELAQHLAEDPLPLRKAKITLEAANKAANKAVDQAEAKLAEAQTFLDKVKTESSGGVAQGNLWWLDRELTEKKKYLPKRLQ